MKVSLITSCFNSEATIRATLDSVRLQEYSPIEYIIVDGGSSDGTLNILEDIMSIFETKSIDAVYGDLDYVDRERPRKIIRRWRSASFDRRRFFNGWMPAHPTFYLKREHYEKYGGYRTDMRISADYELMLRMLLKNNLKAEHIPEVLVNMRVGGASNISLENRIQANKEDRMAWAVNELKPRFYTSLLKPLSKLRQFV